MKRYFYVTTHFMPKYEETTFKKYTGDIYIHNETKEIYIKRPLYDFGWGQESGFELLPQLSFKELIVLVEQPLDVPKRRFKWRYKPDEVLRIYTWRSNLYGAVSVIMEDYTAEFIDFLSGVINTDYFSNPTLRKNYMCFSFNSEMTFKEGRFPGGIGTRSYEQILNDFPEWKKISERVIKQIYV